MSAKRLLKRSTVCGVSEISGTRTMAVLPRDRARRESPADKFPFCRCRSRRGAKSASRFSGESSASSISSSACVCSWLRVRLRRRNELFVSMWIARDSFFAQVHEAAFLQRPQRLIVERGLPREVRRAGLGRPSSQRSPPEVLPAAGARRRNFSSSSRVDLAFRRWTNNCFFHPTSARRMTCGRRLRMTASIGQQ